MAKNSNELIELAVKGMLPKNSLGRQMYKNYLCIKRIHIRIQHKNQKHYNHGKE